MLLAVFAKSAAHCDEGGYAIPFSHTYSRERGGGIYGTGIHNFYDCPAIINNSHKKVTPTAK